MESRPVSLLPITLASSSPRRRRLLAELGYQFQVLPADVDETPPVGLAAEQVAEQLALRKASTVAARVDAGTVIGADTVVVSAEGELLGKPTDHRDAVRILNTLSGSTHRVITAVALIYQACRSHRNHRSQGPAHIQVLGHDSTSVTMLEMTRKEIDEYVVSGEPFGKAGAYAIQESGDRFVSRLVGEYDNVVGLPCRLLGELLESLSSEVREKGGGK